MHDGILKFIYSDLKLQFSTIKSPPNRGLFYCQESKNPNPSNNQYHLKNTAKQNIFAIHTIHYIFFLFFANSFSKFAACQTNALMQSPVVRTKTTALFYHDRSLIIKERYHEKGQNPKYRLNNETADFLSRAKGFGIDKLTAVMDEEEELPFFLNIEDGDNELPEPLVIDFSKTLVLSDVHLGFHDRTAVEAAIRYGRKNKADCIILNGDILDMYQLSRFDKTPNKGAIVNEIKLAREFFRILREVFPNAEIYFKKGNHEERYNKYFAANAKELYGFDDFLLESIIHCDNYGIRTIEDRQLVSLGKLNIYHGHEIGGGGVHVAAGLVTKTNANILCGHWHKTQTYTKTRLNEQPIAGFAVGCLCKLNPFYLPNNQWNHGFAFVDTASGGTFHVHNKRIINGQAV